MKYARPTPLVASMSIFGYKTHALFLLLLGLVILSVPGCTSTQQVSHDNPNAYRRVTLAAAGETTRVTFRDRPPLQLENLYVDADSTEGLLPNGERKIVPSSSIRTVEVIDREKGFWQGMGLGFGSVFALGVAKGLTAEEDWERDLMLITGAIVGSPIGLITGLLGTIKGQRDIYRFQDASVAKHSAALRLGQREAHDSSQQ